MPNCPYCAHETDAGNRVCKKCGRALIQRCVACAEDIPVLMQVCPLCKSPQHVPAPPPAMTPPPPPPALPNAPLGSERNIIVTLLLSFITCGIYSLVVRYQLGTDFNAHSRRPAGLQPGLDIVLGIVTCGFWFIYTDYRYAQELKNICEDEQAPVQDLTVACLVLTLFGFGIVSVLILQNEANTHWKRHQRVS